MNKTFTIKLAISPDNLENWQTKCTKYIYDNYSNLSNMENGHIIEISQIKYGPLIIEGFLCKPTCVATIKAKTQKYEVDEFVAATIESVSKEHCIGSAKYIKFWIPQYFPIGDEKIVKIAKLRYASGKGYLATCYKSI